MQNLEQTVEKSFFGRVKDYMGRARNSAVGKIAVYSLAGVLGAGLGCGCGSEEDNQPIAEQCVDNDGDGYGKNCVLGEDCDDSYWTVFPGSEEICDGLDNNCDGEVDEGCLDCEMYGNLSYSSINGKCCTEGEQGNLMCVDSSFESPKGDYSINLFPQGLAWDGKHLWSADCYDQKIYKLTTAGEILDYFNSPGDWPTGLAWDGQYLWNANYHDYDGSLIFKLTTTGEILDSFNSPGSYPHDLTWDGKYLWNADDDTDNNDHKIYKLTTTGEVLNSFDSPGFSPTGLAWDGKFLWNADDDDHKIYKLTTAGEIINSFYSPGYSPTGLTWDGKYLWNADDSPSDWEKIYKLEIIK